MPLVFVTPRPPTMCRKASAAACERCRLSSFLERADDVVRACAGRAGVLVCRGARRAPAQEIFTDTFPAEEFAARRAKVIAAIGDGVAIVHGAPERSAEDRLPPEQSLLLPDRRRGAARGRHVIDGRTKQTTAVPAAEERAAGAHVRPGAGPRRGGRDARPVSTPSSIASSSRPRCWRSRARGGRSTRRSDPRCSAADRWARRWATPPPPPTIRGMAAPSREAAFIAKLEALAPQLELRNLDPVLDAVRFIKSPREIAVIREATRITGLGIMEAMREAERRASASSSCRRRPSTCSASSARRAPPTFRCRRAARRRCTRTTTRARSGWPTATWCSSTTRPTIGTTSPTSPACSRPTAASRRSSARSTRSICSSIAP